MKYWRVTLGSLADAGTADYRSHYKKSIIVQRVCFSVKTKINGHGCLHARHVWNMIHSFSSLAPFVHKTTINIKFIWNCSKFVYLEPSVFRRIKIWYKYKGICGKKTLAGTSGQYDVRNIWAELYLKRLCYRCLKFAIYRLLLWMIHYFV